jgi:urease accessory protein
MLTLVPAAVTDPDPALPVQEIVVERRDLARRRWRVAASDGHEFGFELARPLQPGDTIAQSGGKRYVLRQRPEPVLFVSLELAASAAAGLGWAFGNMHLEASTEPGRLIVADTPAARQLLARLGLAFTTETHVFRPGRFARGALPAHELGPSHQH